MTKTKQYFSSLALAALISTTAFAADTTKTAGTTATSTATTTSTLSDLDKVSYSIGVQTGTDYKQQDIQVNTTMFMQGFSDAQKTGPVLMTEEEIKTTLVNFQKTMIQKQQENQLKLSAKNLEEGTKYLEENKTKPGVVTLPSGLQYRVIQVGTGPKPTVTDTVTTHYTGKLINGKEFDSSYSRGEPAQFQVNTVIPAWTEALQLMQPGAKWEIVVPPKLGFGENGVGRVIGPNATLVFDIELISINPKNTSKATDTTSSAPKKTNTKNTSSKATPPTGSQAKTASQSISNKS